MFVDGWRTAKLWLGPGCHAVGIAPRRVYLQRDGSRDERPEREIVDLRTRPKTPVAERLRGLLWFLDRLQVECAGHLGDLVDLTIDDTNPLERVTVRGRRKSFPAETAFRTVHEQGDFLCVPDELEALVCCDERVGPAPAEEYRDRAISEFKKRGVNASIRHVDLRQLEMRLDALNGGDQVKRRDVPVVFMLAKEDGPPSDRLRRVMDDMDKHGLPWRRAYATDDRQWSVADQVGSLLQAAGGHPHEVVLPNREPLPWSIGIDISRRQESARVAATLMSPEGELVGAWTADQARKENIEPSVLRRLLGAAAKAVPERDRAKGMLVVRDGRVFESESAEDYQRNLGGPVTLAELRKRNNPPLLLGSDMALPARPTVGWFTEAVKGSLGFLVPLPRSEEGAFGSVLKLWMAPEWDGLRLGGKRLARVLLAQTLTPGLGLHRRRLPAPIYWADGIAGASDDDLRFRGRPVEQLD